MIRPHQLLKTLAEKRVEGMSRGTELRLEVEVDVDVDVDVEEGHACLWRWRPVPA